MSTRETVAAAVTPAAAREAAPSTPEAVPKVAASRSTASDMAASAAEVGAAATAEMFAPATTRVAAPASATVAAAAPTAVTAVLGVNRGTSRQHQRRRRDQEPLHHLTAI